MSSKFAPLLALAILARTVSAAEIRLELRVTSTAGAAVYVDRGSAGGLVEGDRVEFRLESGSVATGIVRSATVNSARVELDPGSERPPRGTRGEARVPDSRPNADSTPPANDAIDHAPWTHPPEEWNNDRPLLAPAFGLPPEARAANVHGRAWFRFDGSRNDESGDTYSLFSVGTDTTLENPFGDGGAVRVAGEIFARSADVDGDDGLYDYDDAGLRLDHLAYSVGGTEDRPNQFLVGRFLQEAVPEFGVLDGFEWNRRTRGGTSFGASVGWMPEPTPDRSSFEDVQAAVNVRQAFGADEAAEIGVGWQSTWHDGEADRNLAVVEAGVRPSDAWSVRATAWVDLYDSSDTLKSTGFELTEARLAATWRANSDSGLRAFVAQRRIPELLRDEFLARRADDVMNSVLDRIGVSGWTGVGNSTRLDARLEGWSDEEDEGFTGELGVGFEGVFGDASSLTAAASWADGSYSSGPGGRLQANIAFGSTRAGLGWHSAWYSQKDYGGDDADIAQHAAFGSLDVALSDDWDLSFVVDRSFGDGADGWTAGFLVQARY